MNAAMLLLMLLCASSALCKRCGQPNRRHPPNLRTSGDRILGLKQAIVGGDEAEPHSYPWMAYLSNQLCGGSLINNQWILTAAHCVVHQGKNGMPAYVTPQQVKVRLGAHNKVAQGGGRSQYNVQRVVVHPDYRGRVHDLALIQLNGSVQFDTKVWPICLPDAGDNFQNYSGGAVLAGWGSTYLNEKNSSDFKNTDVLKHLVLSVSSTCAEAQVGDIVMCAKAERGSGCFGDSGSPLAVLQSGRYTQAGIVSSGVDALGMACPEGIANVYTHVPAYMDWIKGVAGV